MRRVEGRYSPQVARLVCRIAAVMTADEGATVLAEAGVAKLSSSTLKRMPKTIAARCERNRAQIALNRWLHRPIEESFRTAEMGLEDPVLVEIRERFEHLISNQWYFREFRNFLVELSQRTSPDLWTMLVLPRR